MKSLKAVSNKIFDVFEIYLPCVAFIILFVSFIIMIAYRYIFYNQMSWLFELNGIAYIWSAILAASYGSRADTHVVFPIVYDKLSDKKKLMIRLVSNIVVIVAFFILFPYALKTVEFFGRKISPIIEIPYSVIFAPFYRLCSTDAYPSYCFACKGYKGCH